MRGFFSAVPTMSVTLMITIVLRIKLVVAMVRVMSGRVTRAMKAAVSFEASLFFRRSVFRLDRIATVERKPIPLRDSCENVVKIVHWVIVVHAERIALILAVGTGLLPIALYTSDRPHSARR